MKRYISILFAVCASLASAAQNLNPQVQVSNDYQLASPGERKQDIELNVPDYATKFDYNFDYSVFESPYRGAYDFTPYIVGIDPEKGISDAKKLYLKVGGGYNLYPELKAVYSAFDKDSLSLNIVQDLDGYWGNYWMPASDMGAYQIKWKGFDLEENLAANFKWNAGKLVLSSTAGYNGIYNEDYLQSTFYHAGNLSVRIKSRQELGNKLNYDFVVKGLLSTDNVSPQDFIRRNFYESDLSLNGSVGWSIDSKKDLAIDLRFQDNTMGGAFDGVSKKLFSVAPRVKFKYGRFDFDLGVAADYSNTLSFHPRAQVSMYAFRNTAKLYLGAKGGQTLTTYSYLKHFDRFFNPAYNENWLKTCIEQHNVYLGIDGYLGTAFNYSAKLGTASYYDAPFQTVYLSTRNMLPGVDFFDYSKLYANVKLSWTSDVFDACGTVDFCNTSLSAADAAVPTPKWHAYASARYNYRQRVFLGVNCEFKGSQPFLELNYKSVTLPFFVDLGANVEYRINSKWGVWIAGGNLLNGFVRRTPLHIEEGINFTAGICLNL